MLKEGESSVYVKLAKVVLVYDSQDKVKQMLALLSESMEPRENKRGGSPTGHWSGEIKRCGSTMILTLITAGQLKGHPDPHPLQLYAQLLPMTLALPLRVRPFFFLPNSLIYKI